VTHRATLPWDKPVQNGADFVPVGCARIVALRKIPKGNTQGSLALSWLANAIRAWAAPLRRPRGPFTETAVETELRKGLRCLPWGSSSAARRGAGWTPSRSVAGPIAYKAPLVSGLPSPWLAMGLPGASQPNA